MVSGAEAARDRIRLPHPEAAAGIREDLLERLRALPEGHPSALPDGGPGADRGHGARLRYWPVEGTATGQATADHRQAAPERQAAPDGRPGYWERVPEFRRMWAEHEARWPAPREAAAADRPADPAGSWRGVGNQYLSPGQHAEACRVIEMTRQREGQISADMRQVERENSHGARLAGWEFRLKGPERLKEKIAAKIEHEPGRSPADATRGINDAVRYTFRVAPDRYADAYRDVKSLLADRGYTMTYSKNHWRDDPEYKGINTRWLAPSGQRFEVQFHTAESLHAKQEITHGSYERIRIPLTSDDERGELASFQRAVSSALEVPVGIAAIPDYRKEVR